MASSAQSAPSAKICEGLSRLNDLIGMENTLDGHGSSSSTPVTPQAGANNLLVHGGEVLPRRGFSCP
jgi:hypothetical protein